MRGFGLVVFPDSGWSINLKSLKLCLIDVGKKIKEIMTTESLFEQLKHPNPNLRERAMYQLAEVVDEQTIPRLMSILSAEDIVYRRAAVKSLGVIGLDAVPFLVDSLLNSENSTIRGSCAKGLAQVAVNHPERPFPQEGIEGLAKALHDPDPVVHIASAMALGAIGNPALPSLLEGLETTENIALAIAIINALSSINDPEVTVVLEALAKDEAADSYIQESAVSALSRLQLLQRK